METSSRVISQSYKLHLKKSKWDREAASRVGCLQLSSHLQVKPSSLWQALTPCPHHGCFSTASQKCLEVPKNVVKTPKSRELWPSCLRILILTEVRNQNTGWGKQKSRSKNHTRWFHLLCGCMEICRSQCGHWLHKELSLTWILLKHQRQQTSLQARQGEQRVFQKNGHGTLLLGRLLYPTGRKAANPELYMGVRKTPHHMGESLVKATSAHW